MWPQHVWELIWQLAKTDFKLRYVGSHLGYLWALLKPFIMFVVIHSIFSHVFASQLEHYSLHLLFGLVTWTYFAEASKNSLEAFTSKANLLKKATVPKPALIIAATLSPTITLVINTLITLILIVAQGIRPTAAAIMLTITSFILLYIFTTAIGFAGASLHTRYRDIGQLWELILRLGFFVTPIVYPLSVLPLAYQSLLWFNPPGYLIQISKSALISGELPAPSTIIGLIAITAACAGIGLLIFRHQHQAVTEYL